MTAKRAAAGYAALLAAIFTFGWFSLVLHAQVAVTPLAVRVYFVPDDPAAFTAIPLCKCLIHRNGLFQSPGVDYVPSPDGFVFGTGRLVAGDNIEVVAIP